MCGYVLKQTKMQDLNTVLEAIEHVLPELAGKLGRVNLDGTATGGALAQRGAMDLTGGGIDFGYGRGRGRSGAYKCQVVLPPEIFGGSGNGLGLMFDTKTGTWTLVRYDSDVWQGGKFDQEFDSKVFLEYGATCVERVVQQLPDGKITAKQTVKGADGQTEIHGTYEYTVEEEVESTIDTRTLIR